MTQKALRSQIGSEAYVYGFLKWPGGLALTPGGRRLALLANPLASPLALEVRTAQQAFADLLGGLDAFFVFGRYCYVAHIVLTGPSHQGGGLRSLNSLN